MQQPCQLAVAQRLEVPTQAPVAGYPLLCLSLLLQLPLLKCRRKEQG